MSGCVRNPHDGPRWLELPEVDPEARAAVEKATKAYEKKQWDKLGEQISAAKEDPILGHYPEYWWLVQQLEVKAMPVREAALQRYIEDDEDTYLAERLKGDWAVATARAGGCVRILDFYPPTIRRAVGFCAQAHSLPM